MTDEKITFDQMIRSDTDPDSETVKLVMPIMNLVGQVLAPIRSEAQGGADSSIMTALVVLAGAILGEAQYCLGAPDIEDEALASFLVSNFQSGIEAGKQKCARIAEETGLKPRKEATQ